MSDTTEQECACCGFDTDCIDGLCQPCNDFNYKLEKLHKQVLNKPITEHPDVQRLIGQVVELQAEIERLKDALVEYGTHGRSSNTIMCERDKHSDYPCTCGFEQALKGE